MIIYLGMLNNIAVKQYPDLFFRSLEMDEAYPNGESPNEFHMRIKKWFSEFVFTYRKAEGNILLLHTVVWLMLFII